MNGLRQRKIPVQKKESHSENAEFVVSQNQKN